jgi:hypothetical protein
VFALYHLLYSVFNGQIEAKLMVFAKGRSVREGAGAGADASIPDRRVTLNI